MEGTYIENTIVNGKMSWKSTDNAIWYVPSYDSWTIGSLANIGATDDGRLIASADNTGSKNPECVPSDRWYYRNNGWESSDIDDIIVQCVESKY